MLLGFLGRRGLLRLCFHGNHWHRQAPQGTKKGNLAQVSAPGSWWIPSEIENAQEFVSYRGGRRPPGDSQVP